jgi:hypothetical protein
MKRRSYVFMSSGPFLPEEKKVVLSLISCTAIGAAEV